MSEEALGSPSGEESNLLNNPCYVGVGGGGGQTGFITRVVSGFLGRLKGAKARAESNGLDNLCGLIVPNQWGTSPLPCRCPQVWRNQNGYIALAFSRS